MRWDSTVANVAMTVDEVRVTIDFTMNHVREPAHAGTLFVLWWVS